MLVCDYIGSNFPGGKKSSRKKFFAIYPRLVSDRVTHEIIKRLGFSDVLCYMGDGTEVPDLYGTYTRLPKLDPSQSSYALIQAHALFSKNGDMRTDIDKEGVALESFLESERSCESINALFSSRNFSYATSSILGSASRYVSHVLGNCPTLEDLEPAFGPGASVTDAAVKQTSPQWKLAGTPTISNSLIPKLDELRASFPHWIGNRKVSVSCGRLEFVPKSFKTHRSIMIEPSVNAFLQKGVGSLLKRRLLSKGIDLRDQSVQRDRARLSSIDDSFATIDLSRASDSIAYLLVMELLPLDWFDLLDSMRTPLATYRKKLIVLEKFSSMGNGFTFELETLIFKALVHGIAEYHGLEDDSVCYGDDITCSPSLAEHVLEHFPSFGFTVNEDKSFVRGPFKEACGGDYRNGIDIRPFFLKSLRDGGRWSPAKLVSFYNFLKRKEWFDANQLSDLVLSFVPEPLRRWGPDGYGDGHLLSRASPSSYLRLVHAAHPKSRSGHEGYEFETFVSVQHRCDGPSNVNSLPSYVAYAGLSREGPYDPDVVRPAKGAFIGSKIASVTLSPVTETEVSRRIMRVVSS